MHPFLAGAAGAGMVSLALAAGIIVGASQEDAQPQPAAKPANQSAVLWFVDNSARPDGQLPGLWRVNTRTNDVTYYRARYNDVVAAHVSSRETVTDWEELARQGAAARAANP